MTAEPDALLRTQRFLHEQIPLTRAMEIAVEAWDGEQLVLTAPLEPNHNHLGTAFGGSLSALATVAGYALLWLLLESAEAHIVVRESQIRYRRPVRGTLRAVCVRPAEAEWQGFRTRFAATGKADLKLAVEIVEGDEVCVRFSGTFVALT